MKNHEWLTRNSLRAFPVREGGRIIASNSGWSLDPSLIVDASIFSDIPGDVRFCLQSVTVTKAICSVVIGDAVSGSSLGYVNFVSGADNPFSQKPLVPFGEGFSGFISFGPAVLPENYTRLPQGIHEFGNTALLEARCGMSIGPFPVKTMRVSGFEEIRDNVIFQHGDALKFTLSDGEHEGDPMKLILLSLVNPSQFLSPCENKTTPCECKSPPISFINGVGGDEDGRVTIELVDENGNIFLLGQSTLQFSIVQTAEELCSRQLVPDQYGRLPGPSGNYAEDLPPINGYKNPSDTTFPLPVI